MNDVTIIGGGPAGCKAASLLSGDMDVTVVEEHDVSGIPVQCTGLISDDVIRLSGVNVDVLGSLYGANVHFPGGGVISVRSKKRKGVLIDRAVLDKRMADAAMDAGAVFQYGTRYVSHSCSDSIVRTETTKGTLVSKIIVGADGHSSAVARSLGNNGPKEYVKGVQFDVRNTTDDPEMMDIFLGSDAPGFFAWLIPFEDMTRVGLCSSGDIPPSEHLKNILRRTGLQDKTVVRKYSGKIPLGGRRTTFGDGTLLIGDAAGQVKPISGGGLYPAFMSSHPLAETVREAIASGDTSAGSLRRYETRWKKEIWKELRNGYLLRRMFKRMDDRSMDEIFAAADREEMRSILNEIDLDSPSDVILPMLKDIGVVTGFAMPVLKGILRGNR